MFKITDKDKESFLFKLAEINNFDINNLVAIYLIIGDDLFFLSNVLKGKTIKFPVKQTFCEVSISQSIIIKEVPVNSTYVIGNIVENEDNEYEVIREPCKILNHWYIVLKKLD